MNFTHKDITTIINNYVPVSPERQEEIIKAMRPLSDDGGEGKNPGRNKTDTTAPN